MSTEFAFCDLWHPSGVRVRMPFAPETAYDAISAAIAAGWLVDAPGHVEGESKEECGFVVKSSKDSRDGSCWAVDLYPANDQTRYAFLRVYLNTPADEAAFEAASGMKLASIPEYVGSGRLERGNRQTDKLIARCPRPFSVFLKANPKFDPNETDTTKKKPKRIFVRWGSQAAPAATGEPQHEANDGHADADKVNDYKTSMEEAQSMEELNGVAGYVKADSVLTSDGRQFLRGVYETNKLRIEKMEADGIPF